MAASSDTASSHTDDDNLSSRGMTTSHPGDADVIAFSSHNDGVRGHLITPTLASELRWRWTSPPLYLTYRYYFSVLQTMALTDTSGKGVCSQCLSSKGTEEDILMLQCSFCSCFIHTTCLRVEDPPFTTLAGDNFFDLVCSECSHSDDGFDIVRRGRMKVHVAILLALYNLHKNSPRPARDGFYHWREDIFSYINRHHHLFFPQEQTRIVPASFCATMTKFPNWIESGNSNPLIKGRGYYRLVSVKPPAVLLMQTVGSIAAVGGTSAQRPSSKRGGAVSRPPVSRLRSPRTRQNLRDLAQAVEEAAAELKVEEPSASSSSPCATGTEATTTTACSSSSGIAAAAAAPMSDDEEEAELTSRRDFEGFGRLSRSRGASHASADHPRDKRDNGSPKTLSSVLRRRRESSGSGGHRGGSSSSPRTRFSPRIALGNSSPMESNFKWFDNLSAVPQLDKNLDMIFSDDFLAIANVEEVVGSSENNRAPISGSPCEHSPTDHDSPRDNNTDWSGNIASASSFNRETSGHNSRTTQESDFRTEDALGNEVRNGSNILHSDALRNSLSQNKKMSKNRGRGTKLLSPLSSMDKTSKRNSESDLDAAMDTRSLPPAPSVQSNEAPLPHKRHKLALTFRPNKEPFVLDKQYEADMQYVESLTPKNMYEEVQLLKNLDDYYNKVGAANFSPLLAPLRRKLTVRKEQRLHNIGVFNPHAEAKSLQEKGRCLTNKERIDLDNHNKFGVTGFHLLDRFLKAEEVEQEREWPLDTPFRERLLGTDIRNKKPFSSPYSGKLLLPYYLQLKEYKKPLKLLLNEEIKIHSALGELTRAYNPLPPPEGSAPIAPPADVIQERLRQVLGAPLHFAPARSEHIPQMDALARQCFWPGICLSEVLKYPEFTCVALYRFLVIGFGVAVPDAGICGEEAYLSFLVVHPEWRRSKIASTILYCLSEEISTDITLHVSPSNHAMILYQRFGFKSEEFIKNFYDKYLPADQTDSKHAFFMRRRRIL